MSVATGTIRASDIATFGRMDATFHLARTRVEARTAALEASLPRDEAVALVSALPIGTLGCLQPLMRGSQRLSAATLPVVLREYPHLALALVQESAAAQLVHAEKRIADEAATAERLRSISNL